MQKKTVTDENGRNHEVFADGDLSIPIGPPDIVDDLKLPEPFATRLHNALHANGLFTYADVAKSPRTLQGVLQEALQIDIQILTESYRRYEQEVHHG